MLIECSSGISSCDIRSFSAINPVRACGFANAWCLHLTLLWTLLGCLLSFVSQYFSWTWPTKNGLAGAYQEWERSASWYAKSVHGETTKTAKPPIAKLVGPRAVRWQLLCKDSKAKTQATLWMGKDGNGLPKWYPKKMGIEWILRKLHNTPGTIYPWKEFVTCWLMKDLESGVCCRGIVCWKDLEWDQWRCVLMMVSSRESFPSVSAAQWFSISWALGRYSNSTSLETSFFRAQDTMLLNGIDALPSTLCVFILESERTHCKNTMKVSYSCLTYDNNIW